MSNVYHRFHNFENKEGGGSDPIWKNYINDFLCLMAWLVKSIYRVSHDTGHPEISQNLYEIRHLENFQVSSSCL